MTTALSTGIRRAAARIAPDPAPDGELLSRFLAASDEAAFAVLVRRHAAMVFGTCRRVLGNAPDADDAFQAAFVVLVRKAHSLTDRACVGNFLYGVAFHTALKARAMATKRKAKEARANIPLPTSTDSELTIMLDEELARLPEKYREPVVLCELEGVSRRDAAGRLGVPEGTISSRLATAHRMLEKRLKARGFAAAGIAAVLGNQAFAVSDSLADAAVRAAVNGPPAGVTHLAAEVTKMFLLTKLKVGTAVLASVVLLLGAGVGFVQRGVADDKAGLKAPVPKKDEKRDEELIQGLWEMTRTEAGGKPQPDVLAKKVQYKFEKTVMSLISADGTETATFKLDSTTKPKSFDIVVDGPGQKGPNVGKTLLGIYELDGDTLRICVNLSGDSKARPSEFKTADKPGMFLFRLTELKRVKEEKKDEDAIQGLWQAESLEADGQKAPDEAAKGFQIRFKGTDITFVADGRTHTFELDPSAKPKALNLTPSDGTDKGKKLECAIYDLDGDTLKICMDKEGQAGKRPAEFKTAANDGLALMLLKRVKEQAKKPDAAEAIQGTWTVTELHQVGKKMTDEEKSFYAGGGYKITFTADTMTHEIDKSSAKYRLDPTRDEKLIEFVENGAIVALALYDLNGDDLKLSVGRRAKPEMPPVAPTGFDVEKAPAGTFPTVYVMKRDKPKSKAAANKPDDATAILGQWAEVSSADFPPRVFAPTDKVFKAKNFWTFGADGKLTSVSTVTDETHTGEGQYELKPAASPKELTLTRGGLKMTWSYELSGGTLKVALCSDGKVRPPSIDPKDIPQGVSMSITEFTRVNEEKPADKEYSLKDGEVLKLIPAPFPAEREGVFKLVNQQRSLHGETKNYRMVIPADGADLRQCFVATSADNGWPLWKAFEAVLGIDQMDCVADAAVLERMFDADALVLPDTQAEKLLPVLQAELKAKCGIEVKLDFRDVEREVVVASGSYAKRAPPNQPEPQHVYNLYAEKELDKPSSSSFVFNQGFLPAVGKFVGRPVVDETNLTAMPPINFVLHNHDRQPATEKTKAEDRDPAKVLKNLEAQTGLTFKLEKRKVRAMVVEQTKAADKSAEPAWKAAFRKAYGLSDGQLIRRVAPPYPDCREDYLRDLYKGGTGSFPFAQQFAVFGWKGEWTDPQLGQFTMPVQPDEGVTLERLLDMTLKFPPTRIESDRTSLDRKVTGDWVVRTGADPEKAAVQLEAILWKELEVPVKFAFKDAEEEVFVLSGKYAAKPLDGKKAGHVEVYATYRNSGTTGGGGTGTLKEMAAALERHVSKLVVLGQVEGGPKQVSWHFNDREKGFTRQEYEEDRHAPTVLGNVADQLGLSVTTEKRKVRTLVVEFAKVKK